MGHPYKLNAELFFENKKKAGTAFNAVKVELGQRHEKRSKALMKINKSVVLLEINALDSRALKASMNSYLKLLMLSDEIMEVF